MEVVFSEPSRIEVEAGLVRKVAPDGSRCAMTPEAAAATAVEMLAAAADARGLTDLEADAARRGR